MFLSIRSITCGLLLLMPLSAPAAPLTPEAMWGLLRLGAPTISPDGRAAVLPVTRFDMEQNKGLTDLWLIPVAGGPARQLTSDAANDTQPVFSPDGAWIAFVSKRGDDKESQVYLINVAGGEARRVTNVPTGADALQWFPDSKRIAFVSKVWPDLVKWEDQGKRLTERTDSKMTAKVWDRAPIAYWDHHLDDREPQLFSISIDGGEPLAITRGSGLYLSRNEYDSTAYAISPDGEEVAFVADTDRTGIAANEDLIVLAACGCKPARNITPASQADDGAPQYSPDGRYLAFTQRRIPRFYADRARLMLLDRAGGEVRNLTENWDRSVAGVAWLRDSKGLVGAIDDAATQRVYRFDLRGGAPRAVTSSPSFGNVALARRTDTAVAIRQSFSEPPTLVRLDLRTGAATKLSNFNDVALAGLSQGNVENVTYKGAGDQDIQMWIVHPPDFDPARKYPVFMLLHGGPHSGIGDAVQWRWNAQVFANWGYIVTWHNFHGSSGFGEKFTDSINPDWVTMPYEDTIKAAEWLAAKPYVDEDRMVAGGGSYGGYLASVLLGRAHPFKALIAHAAVYNLYTQYASDGGAEKARFYDFWERPEDFARTSPHLSAAKFATPTLVIHGQQDLRVPVNHGVELFNTLQTLGVPSKLVYFPDENHWILKPQNSIFWYQTVKDWLAKYAPPGAREPA